MVLDKDEHKMKKLNRVNMGLEAKPPIKVVQFGEGNFLRAFIGLKQDSIFGIEWFYSFRELDS